MIIKLQKWKIWLITLCPRVDGLPRPRTAPLGEVLVLLSLFRTFFLALSVFSTFFALVFLRHLPRPAGLSFWAVLHSELLFTGDSESLLEPLFEQLLSESDELNLGLARCFTTLLMLLSMESSFGFESGFSGVGFSLGGGFTSSLGGGLLHDLRTVAIVRRRPSVWELVTLKWGGVLLEDEPWLELELSLSDDE